MQENITATCPRCGHAVHHSGRCAQCACRGPGDEAPPLDAEEKVHLEELFERWPEKKTMQTRCYQCGKVIDTDDAVRREVTTGQVFGQVAPGGTIAGAQTQRVDFCRACARFADDSGWNIGNWWNPATNRGLLIGLGIIFLLVAVWCMGFVTWLVMGQPKL